KIRSRAASADTEIEDLGTGLHVAIEQVSFGTVQLLFAIVVGDDLLPAIYLRAARKAHARPQARPDWPKARNPDSDARSRIVSSSAPIKKRLRLKRSALGPLNPGRPATAQAKPTLRAAAAIASDIAPYGYASA